MILKTVFLDVAGICVGCEREHSGPGIDLATFQANYDATATQRITGAPSEISHNKSSDGYHTKVSGDGTQIGDYTFTAFSSEQYTATHQVGTLTKRRLTKVEWFETDNGDETFSDLAADVVYTWLGSVLLSRVYTVYYTDGRASLQETETYFTGSGKRITRKS